MKWSIIIGIFLVIALIGVGVYYNNTSSVVTTTTFVSPDWGRIELAPTEDVYSRSMQFDITKDDQPLEVQCGGDNFFTYSPCKVTLFMQEQGLTAIEDRAKIWKCKADESFEECKDRTRVWASHTSEEGVLIGDKIREFYIGELDTDEKVFMTLTDSINIFAEEDTGYLVFDYKPWGLNWYIEGARYTRTGTATISQSNQRSRICVDGDDNRCTLCPEELQPVGGEGLKWCNFITDWNYGPALSVFNHPNHGQVYCAGNRIYSIAQLELMDGSTKKISPADTLGSYLGEVECCPNIAGCNDQFKYDGNVEQDCFSDAQCANGGAWIPVGSKQVQREFCSNGVCDLSDVVNVDCSTDYDCSAGKHCNRMTWKCEDDSVISYCGDTKCVFPETNDPESDMFCASDCGIKNNNIEDYFLWIIGGVVFLIVLVMIIIKATSSNGGEL